MLLDTINYQHGVLLVNMPFADVRRPSLALGILHALLKQAGIPVQSLYANLDFANAYAAKVGGVLELIKYGIIFGETLCHRSFFPEKPRIHDICAKLSLRDSELQEKFEILQECAEEFITKTAKEIIALSPNLVGCTSLLTQHLSSLLLLKKIKEADPNIITLLGGAGLDSEMGIANHQIFPFVDYVVSGDADEIIVPLCRELLQCKTSSGCLDLSAIPKGVLTPYHRQFGYPEPAPRLFFDDLDSLPPPNYDDYFASLDAQPMLRNIIKPALIYESSRGCGWGQTGGCHFCGLSGKSHCFRTKSPDKVLTDLKTLTEKYGIDLIEMTDNMMPLKYEKTLLPKLAALGAPYKLFYETRPVSRKDYYKAMRLAGVKGIQPGIESLSTPLLDHMNKGIQSWQTIQTLKWCRQNGFWTGWHLMWNFPNEKTEWYIPMAELIPHLFHLQPPGGLNRMNYCRFSTFWNQYKDKIRLEPDADLKCAFDFEGTIPSELAYRFFQANDTTGDLMELAFSGNYVSEIAQFVLYWKETKVRGSPELLGTVEVGGMKIRDTRPKIQKIPVGDFVLIHYVSSQKEIVLNIDETAMLNDCDDAPLETNFFAKWGDMGRQFVKQYKDDHIFELLDKRIVSLVLFAPLPEEPKNTEIPFGTIL
ncbi:MAG: RiPP maturation radical SAM C-methyltransferase [Planctomycetaceae bacterium]|jgi:magnesium-protoporphyrin IX monomethyl ester (oxidative) cyclase|nr:RiPP maturation radical SAM C-methyltransferase [Planctomycetaceae bacterium]